jgi:hypothetical protein
MQGVSKRKESSPTGANIINYRLFAVIYGTQLRITGKSTEIYSLYILKKSVKMSVNVDNIGPRSQLENNTSLYAKISATYL